MKPPEIQQFNNHEYLTLEGHEEFKKEINEIENKLLPEVAKELEDAIKDGDLTENSAYQTAKEKQGMLDGRIRKIRSILSRAIIMPKEKSAEIKFGSSMRLQKEGGGETEEYCLVGPEEVDSLKGKISYESPLGRALLSKKKGDEIEVLTPKGKINYTIINVE